jgi:hypothetical protein
MIKFSAFYGALVILFLWGMTWYVSSTICSVVVHRKLNQVEKLLKQKHDHAFVIEQSQERADFYAELITLLREIRKL